MLGSLLAAGVAVGAMTMDAPPEAGPSPRPLLHFTAEQHWLNDPNGLIWMDGEFHLFYQYNPEGDSWGHMSWGHAVSKDLLAWEHLPVAIPEGNGVMAFSGTAVLDRGNTSGFGIEGKPALVAVYTGHDEKARRQRQCIAYSVDRGRTFTKFAGNPVLDLDKEDFRDPKVFWHEGTKKWVMVVSLAAEKKVLIYRSVDLKKWEKLSEFGPAGRRDVPNWECPDLFEMKVEGEKQTRWVLVVNVGGNGPAPEGSGTEYFVGTFDGEKFVNENGAERVLWLDRGKDFYAFQSFQDAPEGKRIGMAWMVSTQYAGATPTRPWRGEMTLPREFTLVRTGEGLRMAQRPTDGVGAFLMARGGKETVVEKREIDAGVWPTGISAGVALIDAEFEVGKAERFGVRVREKGEMYTAVGYDVGKREMYVDRRRSGRVDIHPQFAETPGVSMGVGANGRVKMTIVVDRSSVEAFGEGGLASLTDLIFPEADAAGVSVFAEGGAATLVRMRVVGVANK